MKINSSHTLTWKVGLTVAILLCRTVSLFAQASASPLTTATGITIATTDGKIVSASAVRRSGGNVMATVQIGTGGGEIGYAVSSISKIDFPQPPQLTTAADLLAHGKAGEALAQINPVVNNQANFRDIPGNLWPQAVRLKINALMALKQDSEVSALVNDLVKYSLDPEAIRAAKAIEASSLERKGEHEKAIALCDEIIRTEGDSNTMAMAWSVKGQGYLALKDWDSSLLAFLHVPVFYQDQTSQMPGVLIGAARAYEGLEDYAHAKASLEELMKSYPDSTEAAQAKAELKKLENKSSSKPTTNS